MHVSGTIGTFLWHLTQNTHEYLSSHLNTFTDVITVHNLQCWSHQRQMQEWDVPFIWWFNFGSHFHPLIPYSSVSQTFFKWGPLSLVRMFYGPPYSWDYQTHKACPKQCSKHVFATENPSFVVESRVGRVVNFIKCQSWQRKFKDACCM